MFTSLAFVLKGYFESNFYMRIFFLFSCDSIVNILYIDRFIQEIYSEINKFKKMKEI